MPATYTINGRAVSEAEFNAYRNSLNLPTLPSFSENATQAKYSNPSNFASGGGGDFGGGGASGSWDSGYQGTSDAGAGRSSSAFSAIDPRRLDLPVPPGAEKFQDPPTETNVNDPTGAPVVDDLRVKIRVPNDYLTPLTDGYMGDLAKIGGVLFPYTALINYTTKADYSPQTPLHSNFALYFYQRSSVSEISIQGKFTVENVRDAINYLSTLRLLKAITRMKFGLDADAGAPPPVCRLDAYGDMMLKNVPVAVTSFRVDLPDDVDYYRFSGGNLYGNNMVPTRSTIQVSCVPMYSRNELQKFSVTNYIQNSDSGGFI